MLPSNRIPVERKGPYLNGSLPTSTLPVPRKNTHLKLLFLGHHCTNSTHRDDFYQIELPRRDLLTISLSLRHYAPSRRSNPPIYASAQLIALPVVTWLPLRAHTSNSHPKLDVTPSHQRKSLLPSTHPHVPYSTYFPHNTIPHRAIPSSSNSHPAPWSSPCETRTTMSERGKTKQSMWTRCDYIPDILLIP